VSGRCVDPAPPAGLVHYGVTGSIDRYLFPVDPCTEPDRMSACSPGRTDRGGCRSDAPSPLVASGTLGRTLRTPLRGNGNALPRATRTDRAGPSVPPWIQASVRSAPLLDCFAITLVDLCLFSASRVVYTKRSSTRDLFGDRTSHASTDRAHCSLTDGPTATSALFRIESHQREV
jgi:hypothetical protein